MFIKCHSLCLQVFLRVPEWNQFVLSSKHRIPSGTSHIFIYSERQSETGTLAFQFADLAKPMDLINSSLTFVLERQIPND